MEVDKLNQEENLIDPEVFDSIKSFSEAQNLKKTTLTFIASRIPEDQIELLRDAFIKMDRNGDGMLNEDELELGFKYLDGVDMS